MRRRLLVVALASALTVLTRAPAAHADPHSEAVASFEQGRKLRESSDPEKLKEAAKAFERSIALEPSVGAYYNLGLINDQLGRPRDAVDNFRKSRNLAHERGDPREKDAVDSLTKLLDSHTYVILTAPEEAMAAPGFRVVLDGEEVPRAQLNGEVFRTGATHEVVVTATDRKDNRIAAKNKQTVMLALGESTTTALPPPPPPPPPDEPSGGWGWQKWTGVGLMGAGVVSAAIGVAFVAGYFSDRDDLKGEYKKDCSADAADVVTCKSGLPPVSYQTRADDLDHDAALKHTVTFGLAGAAIAGGLYLFLTAPSSSDTVTTTGRSTPPRIRVAPRVGQSEQGLSVVGTF